jgi:hypothetical protein
LSSDPSSEYKDADENTPQVVGLKYFSDTDIPPNAQIIDTIRTPKKRSRHFFKNTSHYQQDNEELEPGAAPERLQQPGAAPERIPQPGTPPQDEQQPDIAPEDGNSSTPVTLTPTLVSVTQQKGRKSVRMKIKTSRFSPS